MFPSSTRLISLAAALAIAAGLAATTITTSAQPASAQPASAPQGFHLVQRIDQILVGVDTISLDVVGRDHVAGTYFLVHAHKPSPMIGYANYVVDCREPRQIAVLSSVMPSGRLETDIPFVQPARRSGEIDVSRLGFVPVHVMDGSFFVAAFTCLASSAPGRARQIAAELAERGGPEDRSSLYCELRPDASPGPRRVEVRFSPAENVVAVNGQWLSSGFLTEEEIVFGAGAQWRVDRKAHTAKLVRDNGEMLFQGACHTQAGTSAVPAPR